jgi:TfoX/Sxy family transcriptional regulator of competence genes
VAYDVALADRLRTLLAGERGVEERRMFGGLAFLLDGTMAVAAVSQGGLMVRADPSDTDRLLTRAGARRMEMRGRPMAGWLVVDADALRTRRQLESWLRVGTATARAIAGTTPG